MDDNLTFEFGKQAFTSIDYLMAMGVAEALAPLLFFIALCLNYIKSFIESKGDSPKFYDAAELKRTIIIMVMIPFTPAMIWFVFWVGDVIGGFFEVGGLEEAEKLMKIYARANENELNMLFPDFNTIFSLISLFFLGLSSLIKSAMLMLSGFLKGFFIVVSPIAIAFSILPFLKDQFIKLVKLSLNISFVLFTFNILDKIFYSAIDLSADKIQSLAPVEFMWFVGAMSFCLCVLYIMAIWLTSVYVGDPASAAVMTTAATMATAIVMSAAKIASAVGSGGASAALNAGGGGSDLAKDIAESVVKNDKK